MTTPITRLFLSVTLTIGAVSSSFAHDAHAMPFERIRTESPFVRRVLTAAADRSATFRALVATIEESDVVVHITCDVFKSVTLSGRTVLTTAQPGVRYLRVQIYCQQDNPSVVTIVAHELQHATEIASVASVIDDRSFRGLFARIGFQTCHAPGAEAFETTAARDIGSRVHSEYVDGARAGH